MFAEMYSMAIRLFGLRALFGVIFYVGEFKAVGDYRTRGVAVKALVCSGYNRAVRQIVQ